MTNSSAALRDDSSVDTLLTLPTHTDAVAFAGACRDAALAFVNDADRWGKAELAMWLMGVYGPLTQYHWTYARRRSGQVAVARPTTQVSAIDACTVQRIIHETRAEVMATLERARGPEGGASFAFSMMSAGFVVRCEDAHGRLGWLPTTSARRLTDRVLSLFAVDYLTRPADYETALTSCGCGVIAFAPASCSHDAGSYRSAKATLAPRRRMSTLPYAMVGA
jgi:hypothetical protein